MSNQLLTTKQVADALEFDVRTIRNWCDSGSIFPTARKIPNTATGQWRILSSDAALADMLDGSSDNAAMLADKNQAIAGLQMQLDDCRAALQAQIAETNAANADYTDLAGRYNKLNEIYKRVLADNADLKKYRDHYQQQQQNQQRRAA